MDSTFATGICFLAIAMLYSTVGHAGASGYLAAMALLSFSPAVMKPAALSLNIVVALVASARFYSAGLFSWRLFWPFALASVPMAYLGGRLSVDPAVYRTLVGCSLLFSAFYMIIRFRSMKDEEEEDCREPGIAGSLASGAVIGLVSGLTGVGGGIFLSPLLVIFRWSPLRRVSALAAVFILLNSVSGLAGYIQKGGEMPEHLALWGPMVLAGGYIGSTLGATRFNTRTLRALLSVMLALAGIKMLPL